MEFSRKHIAASDMLMAYQLKHERLCESDENLLWRCIKRNPWSESDLLNFQLREIQFIFRKRNEHQQQEDKIVNLHNLMDRFVKQEMHRRGERVGEQISINMCVDRLCNIFLACTVVFPLLSSIKLTFQTRPERK